MIDKYLIIYFFFSKIIISKDLLNNLKYITIKNIKKSNTIKICCKKKCL